MKIVDTQEMREIERVSFQEYSLTERYIIENVGAECSESIIDSYLSGEVGEENPRFAGKPFLFILGKGNNAADGLSVALHLFERGVEVYFYLAFGNEKGSKEFNHFLKRVRDRKIPEIEDLESLDHIDDFILVDAIFGIGFKMPFPDRLESLFIFLRECRSDIFAIDIPSGVDANTGKAIPFAVEAIETFTIGCPKIGHFVGEGKKLRGLLTHINGGFPAKLTIENPLLEESKGYYQLLDYVLWEELERDEYGHKGLFGHVGIIGGSLNYTGAPLLAAEAALRTGVGLVTVIAPREIIPLLISRSKNYEIMFMPLEDLFLENKIEKFSALVMGPGLEVSEASGQFLDQVLKSYKNRLLLDAGALTLLSQNPRHMDNLKNYKGPIVLTPHLGEMVRYMENCTIEELEHLKGVEKVKNFAQSISHFVLLKSAISSFYTPKGKVFFLDGANSGLAKGGSGDVLAGIVGAHLAMNNFLGIEEAVLAAIFKHHFAGIMARAEFKSSGMLPSDLIDKLNLLPQH